jgi:pantetheine-phosphate adenylyltransferase
MPTNNRIAVCPGTYDPLTNGHLDVIRRTSALFDKVIVAIVNTPARKAETLFTTSERVAFIVEAVGDLANVEVESFDDLTVDFARAHGARAIVRGLRAISDFEYELELNQLNAVQAPDIESIYLMSAAKYSFVRSSGVKELAAFGGKIEGMVPEAVAVALKERLDH